MHSPTPRTVGTVPYNKGAVQKPADALYFFTNAQRPADQAASASISCCASFTAVSPFDPC